jgi:hypothetical protein
LRVRIAASIRCRSIGWSAENMKKSQKMSVMPMVGTSVGERLQRCPSGVRP